MWRSFVVEFRDDWVEFLKAEALIGSGFVVNVGAVHQLQKIIIIDSIMKLLGDSF